MLSDYASIRRHAAKTRGERKPQGEMNPLAHSSEASLDARTHAIMQEAERQLAAQDRDQNSDIPRHSSAAKVQVNNR